MTKEEKKCDILVVDSAGFLNNAPLDDIGEEIVTVGAVVSEIRDKATKERLQVTPYTLQFKEPDTEDIKHVTDFAKKTGDYSALSAVDIRVLALTLRMERIQRNGDLSHLRTEPQVRKTNSPTSGTTGDNDDNEEEEKNRANNKLPGFYDGDSEDEEEDQTEEEEEEDGDKQIIQDVRDLNIEEEEENKQESQDEENEDSESEEDDDDGWITPSNIKEKKRQINGGTDADKDEQTHVKVACMTTDYAMQNVLKQLGLNVFSTDGLLIRETRTWNLRCYTCFKVATPAEATAANHFCPRCGNKTLKRVAVTRNDDGTSRIHINYKRPLSTRGKVFSLPTPKGGKRGVNPVLVADQSSAQMKLTKKALLKTNALNPDYTAGDSPFALHDVTSKSALLGIPGLQKGQNLYFNKKNPNAGARKTGNRKK